MGQGKSKRRIEMGEEKWEEYQRERKNEKAARYKSKQVSSVMNWRYRTKIKLIEYKGGKCERCGFNENIPPCYAFHHLNPSNKEFSIGQKGTLSFDKLKKETDKCQLLCQNCHSKTHWELQREKDNNHSWEIIRKIRPIVKINCPCGLEFETKKLNTIYCSRACYLKAVKIFDSVEKQKRVKKIKIDKICLYCENMFSTTRCNAQFCSKECSHIGRQKVERPTKEQLEKLVWEKPTTHIAKDYGVSDKSIEKWCKSYDIEKPPRGYWVKKEFEK